MEDGEPKAICLERGGTKRPIEAKLFSVRSATRHFSTGNVVKETVVSAVARQAVIGHASAAG